MLALCDGVSHRLHQFGMCLVYALVSQYSEVCELRRSFLTSPKGKCTFTAPRLGAWDHVPSLWIFYGCKATKCEIEQHRFGGSTKKDTAITDTLLLPHSEPCGTLTVREREIQK